MPAKRILLVDDSPTDLRLARAALESLEYEVISAGDGEAAMAAVENQSPDLILLDIILPKKNGFQVCREIKTSPALRHIPVVLVSSKSRETDRFWGISQGADEYLMKPFEDEDLVAMVRRFV